jgi:hypothetical protein
VLLGRRKTWAGGRGKEGGELGRGKEMGRAREAGRREVGPRELLGREPERKGRGEGREGWGFLFFSFFKRFQIHFFSNFKFKLFLTFQTSKTF